MKKQRISRRFIGALEQFIKYQMAIKLITSLLLFPVFLMISYTLMYSKRYAVLTNANVFSFIFSLQGFVFLLLGSATLAFATLLEIGGYIAISARHLKGQAETSYKALFGFISAHLAKLLGVGGIIIVIYLVLILPLTGSGMTIPLLRKFEIPNFISEVIYNNVYYTALYALVLAILAVAAGLLTFVFHFMLIADMTVVAAISSSAQLVKRQFKQFVLRFLKHFIFVAILALSVTIAWFILIILAISVVDLNTLFGQTIAVLLFILQQIGFLLIVAIAVPYEVFVITVFFYDFVQIDPRFSHIYRQYPKLLDKQKSSPLDWLFRRKLTMTSLALIGIIGISIPLGYLVKDSLSLPVEVKIVAHRAGGYHAPENSLEGLAHAVELGVDYVEIDVQRTKDGFYILNHDKTFKRVAGLARTAQEMTLNQIQTLKIDSGANQQVSVPQLDDFLTTAKERVDVLIELKGDSADQQMVDDVVAMIKVLGMQDQVILVSLDYDLIVYTETQYPAIDTGYIYFFSVGDMTTLQADYLIIEETLASEENIDQIWTAGKIPIVWTVNTVESINRFIHEDIYAIITDDMALLQETITEYNQQPLIDRFINLFIER